MGGGNYGEIIASLKSGVFFNIFLFPTMPASAPDAYALAVNLRRAVAQHPENDLEHALYLQEYGLVLPTRFDVFGADGSINLPEGQLVNQASALAQADAIITDAVLHGPFAQGPFLDEVLIACRAIVASAQ